jgi:hypothetical protein
MNPGLSVDHPQLEALEWKAVIEHHAEPEQRKDLTRHSLTQSRIFKTVKN